MNSNNFFIQLIVRLLSKNPKFFKWIQLAFIILVALSAGLSALHVDNMPSWLSWVTSTTTKVSGIVAIILAQLPVPNKP